MRLFEKKGRSESKKAYSRDSIRDVPPSLLATEEQSDGGASRNEVQSQNNRPRMDVKEGTRGRQQDQRQQEQEKQSTEDEPDGQHRQETIQTKRVHNNLFYRGPHGRLAIIAKCVFLYKYCMDNKFYINK